MNENIIGIKVAIKRMMPDALKTWYGMRKAKKMFPEAWKLIKNNRKFKDIHQGKRCFILGNGPSLREQDLALLKDEIVFTCNRMSKDEQFYKFRTSYHFWTDPRLFYSAFNEIEEERLVKTVLDIKRYGSDPVVFFGAPLLPFVKERGLDQQLRIEYIIENPISFPDGADRIDFTKPIPKVSTVVQAEILMAIYMGFSEIVLLGCDCTGFVALASEYSNYKPDTSVYSYVVDEVDESMLSTIFADSTIQIELLNYVDIFECYSAINEIAKRSHVKIINATRGGVLDVFDRKSLAQCFE